jgi:1-acyl-sn-glycerol-3-phosphate acyltransferase
MNWFDFGSNLFAFRPQAALAVAILYAVPLLRLITFPFSTGHPFFMRLNRKFGWFEHAVAWFRDTVVVFFLLGYAAWNIYVGVSYAWMASILSGAASLVLIFISFLNFHMKRKGRLRLACFARDYPDMHPEEFFDHLLCASGAVRHRLPERPYRTIDPANMDFRESKKKRIGLFTKLLGVWSTIWLARLSLLTHKLKGKDFMQETASSLAVIWGAALSRLSRAEVKVEGIEKLDDLSGPSIYLFNHLSFFDFALVPLVMAARRKNVEKKQKSLPCFMVAKDHFLDNPIFHRVLGIGKVCEAAGMIFVERKGRQENAKEAVEDAARKLVHEGLDLAIFPQGTRSHGRVGQNGERIDGGYYAVGGIARLKRDGDHLKKGAAHLAVNAALILRQEGNISNINLIPVAIKGTGVIVPRGSMKIKPNVQVRLRVGEPIIIKTLEVENLSDEQAYQDFVRRLHARIDHMMKAAVMVHADLERRLFEDMRTLVDPLNIEEISIALKPWRGDDFLIYSILDMIYTCKPKYWRSMIGRLVYLIRCDAPRNELLNFKGEIAEKISSGI